jgi:glycosyltransferase involved in cell wall biosynthesis
VNSLMSTVTANPQVGVVITAYNNANTVGEAISTLCSQSYAQKHIFVVVDESSSDETERVVETECAKADCCSVIRCKGVGRSKARNIGWRAVDCPVVMFADGDDVYGEHYLERAVAALFSSPGVGGVCLGGAPLPTGKKLLDDFYSAYGATDVRAQANKQPDWAWVYKMECLTATGGFDESLSQTEDKEFCSRVKQAGFVIAYVGGVNWYRRKAQTFGEFVRKEYLAGRRRVFYYAKRRVYRPIAKGLMPTVLFFAVVALGLVEGATLAVVLVALALALYLVASVRKLGKSQGSMRSLGRYCLMALSATVAFSAGTVHGLLALLARVSGLSRLDTGRF